VYVWVFGCVLHEAAVTDLTQYKSFSEFFRRVLKPGLRPIHRKSILTSPADGMILHCGEVQHGCLEQVKGVTYSLKGFLGPLKFFQPYFESPGVRKRVKFYINGDEFSEVDSSMEKRVAKKEDEQIYQEIEEDKDGYPSSLLTNPGANSLYQCIVYLAPGDYHHFHSPADWTVYARRHFPGELFSVKPSIARWLQGLFNFNERALYVGKWKHGFFSMTAVGATNVGSINVNFDKTLATNSTSHWDDGSFYDSSFVGAKRPGYRSRKGQLFGDFNFGSTIVLLFEAPRDFTFDVHPGQKIKYGEALGDCTAMKGVKKYMGRRYGRR